MPHPGTIDFSCCRPAVNVCVSHLIEVRTMPFLRNAWYVAAWGNEVKAGGLFSRKLLGESVLLYRKEDGAAVAIGNRCPHRFAPLHLGKLKGDIVECAYHGLQFDGTGACVANPHGGGKPLAAARVKNYPLVERYSALWIWMGDADKADATTIPVFEFMVPEQTTTSST